MLLRHFVITSFLNVITSSRVEPARGGKNALNLPGEKFIPSNPRGVHAASRGEIWRVEMVVYRGSNTTLVRLRLLELQNTGHR